jgi:hypothetical protein
MRAVLEVTNGLCAGHRRLLIDRQMIEVGRCCLADMPIEHDPKMSEFHFKIATDHQACYLHDLESSNGTCVNRQPVKKAVLSDNDTITAGETSFVIHIEGVNTNAVVMNATKKREFCDTPCVTYSTSQDVSGLTCYRGDVNEAPPSSLAQQLGRDYRQLLIVDVNRLDPDARDLLADAEPLFDWLPDEARRSASPLIAIEPEQLGRTAWMDEAWGKDALVAIYCDAEEDPPLEHLRRFSGVFARPSILRPQLHDAPDHFVDQMLTKIKAVFVEGPSADSWELIAADDMTPVLERLGQVAGG